MAEILITGGNRGIGLEMARIFSTRGDRVRVACREAGSELESLGVGVSTGFDVTSDEAVARLAAELGGTRIDVLINNAGILTSETVDDLDFERMRRQFEVNTLGPLRVTRGLLGHLAAGARVVMITSRMGSIADNGSGGYYGYRMSKCALNMAAVSLARDLDDRGIAVGVLHPGMVATEMTGRQGIPPQEAAAGLVARIDELDAGRSGQFFHANGEPLPW